MIKLTFPDKSVKEFKEGTTSLEVAKSIGERLAQSAVCAKLNKKLIDLNIPLKESGDFEIITFTSEEGKDIFWHSTSHLLAQAVLDLFPKARLAIGPAIEHGFYYDFDHEPFTPEDFAKIEQKMKDIVKENLEIQRVILTEKEAEKIFRDNPYKLELLKDAEGEITAYKQGDFIDLCRGPHLLSTGKMKSFKLLKTSGAYWRGDEKNKQLQRIYGISYPYKKELKQYLHLLEEAGKRDHRKIGKDLDLYSFHEEAAGMPFWHNKGMILKNELVQYWREEHRKENYQEIQTPIILNRKLWETSGHWKLYKENMYTTKIDGEDFAIKPMNCPGGMLVYKESIHSYRDLPVRIGELGLVHRHELSGVLSGLFRVRTFTQDDAHIFCAKEQLKDEIVNITNLIRRIFATFGFKNYLFTLSVRSEKKKDKYLGTDEGWKAAEDAIIDAMKELKVDSTIEEGEAKFYGPSLDVQIKDALGRSWQCSTIQVDFNLAERFNITYEGKNGKETPFILHRVIYGSLERFIGILVEHFAGKFPLWISPVQVSLLTVADRHVGYAESIKKKMFEKGIRVQIDKRAESIPKKVRDNQVKKINYILVVGDTEEKNKTVNVRTRDNVVHGEKEIDKFISEIIEEIEKKIIK